MTRSRNIEGEQRKFLIRTAMIFKNKYMFNMK